MFLCKILPLHMQPTCEMNYQIYFGKPLDYAKQDIQENVNEVKKGIERTVVKVESGIKTASILGILVFGFILYRVVSN